MPRRRCARISDTSWEPTRRHSPTTSEEESEDEAADGVPADEVTASNVARLQRALRIKEDQLAAAAARLEEWQTAATIRWHRDEADRITREAGHEPRAVDLSNPACLAELMPLEPDVDRPLPFSMMHALEPEPG